ncbi:hypothetical protein CRYUN_Cryun23aG0010500 [Craigia yunnanensis]
MKQSIHEVKHSRWRPANLGTKQEWQERFKNIRIGRKEVEDLEKVENSTMAVPFYDENILLLNMKNDAEAKALEAIPYVDTLVRSGSVDVVVVDSMVALVPKGEFDGKMSDAHMAMEFNIQCYAMKHDELLPMVQSKNLTFSFSSESSIEEELKRESTEDAINILISDLVIFAYISLTLGDTPRLSSFYISSKVLLGLSGVLLVMLSSS